MTLAITKRFNLSELGASWANCYVDYSPATYGDIVKLSSFSGDDDKAKQIEFMMDMIKKHVAGGQVVEAGNSDPVLLKPEHIDELPREIIDKLFGAISGVPHDPKGSEPTGTSSSTD